MDDKELKEYLEQLEAQGWEPRICDTELPVIISSVPCGEPSMLGDEGVVEWRLWPKELLKEMRAVVIRIKGDSMINAGFVDGDEVVVELYDAIKGQRGKDAVLLLKMACEVEWLTEMPSYAEAKKVFENIGAKSNYYDYRDLAMTEEEITWAKQILKI